MRSFHFAIELWSSGFDVEVPDPLVLRVPMGLRLKFVTTIGSERVDPEREFLDNVFDKGDSIFLVVTAVDLERSYPCGIIDGRILKTSNAMPVGVLESHNLHVCLHVMTRDLFGIPVRVDRPPTDVARESPQRVPNERAGDARTRNLDPVIPFQVSRDPLRAKAAGIPKLEDPLHGLLGQLSWMMMSDWLLRIESGRAVLSERCPLFIERRFEIPNSRRT